MCVSCGDVKMQVTDLGSCLAALVIVATSVAVGCGESLQQTEI